MHRKKILITKSGIGMYLKKSNTNMVCASCTKIEYFLVSGEADMIGVIRLVGAT